MCRQRRDLSAPSDDALPLFICDAGYDSVQLAQAQDAAAETRETVLVRLRAGRCFYADPAPEGQPKTCRHRRHWHKFACGDPATWLSLADDYTVADVQFVTVRIRAWPSLHPKL